MTQTSKDKAIERINNNCYIHKVPMKKALKYLKRNRIRVDNPGYIYWKKALEIAIMKTKEICEESSIVEMKVRIFEAEKQGEQKEYDKWFDKLNKARQEGATQKAKDMENELGLLKCYKCGKYIQPEYKHHRCRKCFEESKQKHLGNKVRRR